MNSFKARLRSLLCCAALVGSAAGADEHEISLRSAPDHNVAIPREAFGKPFLISASLIPQSVVATSSGLAGKIVRFELFHDGVDLYESTEGLIVTRDLPARRLITTFPIVDEDDEEVVIDFNKGMKRVYTAGWYSVGGGRSLRSRDRVMETTQGRVFEVTDEGDQLMVRQSVQTRDLENAANTEERYEVRYFIRPHRPGAFKGREHNPVDSPHVRFFQTQPLLEDTTGRPTSKLALFDLKKPITFYYSANTPDDYVESMRAGILYWNKVFGREIVKAAMAPEGVTAPDPTHNVVQWVPWDSAGFAYADILVDPSTGESVRGQAYMTSVFAIGGKSRARVLLRAMRALAEEEAQPNPDTATHPDFDSNSSANAAADASADAVGHRGTGLWPSSSVCDVNPREFAAQFADGLESILANDALTDEAVLRISQDYVLNTVAHEVGHCLGLRHNFAGSLDTTLTHQELDEWLEAYIAQTDPERFTAKISSSSVMDYQVFKARVFSGYRIRTAGESLPHDRAAIHWGYYDNREVVEKNMFFGTDDEVGRWADVNRFDYGADPVISAYGEISDAIKALPVNVIESFIRAKAPRDARDRIPLKQVDLNPQSAASSIATSLGSLLDWFDSESRSLRVERQFDFVGELNRDARFEAHWARLNEQIDALGGVDRAVFAFLPIDLKITAENGKEKTPEGVDPVVRIDEEELTRRLERMLESEAYREWVGLDEETYRFTNEEKALITERGRLYFAELRDRVIKAVCERFARAKRDLGLKATGFVGEEDIVAGLEKRIIEYATEIITAADDAKLISGKVDKSRVTVIDFKFDHPTRLAAAKALADDIGSFSSWSKEAKGEAHEKVKGAVESMLNINHFKKFDDSMLSRPLRDWYLKQQEILKLLPPKKKDSGSEGEKK